MILKLILFGVLPAVCESYEKWNMQTLCQRTISVHGGELHFDSDELPSSVHTCSLTILASGPDDKLSLFFSTYSVGVDCIHTNVTFIDGKSGRPDTSLWPGLKEALCSTDKYMIESQIFTTSGASLTVIFKRNIKTEQGRAHSNFTMKVSSFRSYGVPCDTGKDANGTLYKCINGRCVYKDLLCQTLNPCGDFQDECPQNAPVEPDTVPIIVPILIILTCMILLFFFCQVFLMVRNGKCPCKKGGYSDELERQTSNASAAVSQNGEIHTARETEKFIIA